MKFEKNLRKTNKEILDSRAKIICEEAEASMDKLVKSLETEYRKLKRQVMNLEDLAPDTSFSLNPVKGEFDADKWANNLVNVKLDMAISEQKLSIAKNAYDEYFSEED